MPDICAWKVTHLVRHTYVHCLDNPVNETIQYTEYATTMSTLMTHGIKLMELNCQKYDMFRYSIQTLNLQQSIHY
jgi:hypothetical protein